MCRFVGIYMAGVGAVTVFFVDAIFLGKYKGIPIVVLYCIYKEK
jgi:hypothetical protein